MEIIADRKQIQGLVSERNLYRRLLEECLICLRSVKMDELAGKVEQALKEK